MPDVFLLSFLQDRQSFGNMALCKSESSACRFSHEGEDSNQSSQTLSRIIDSVPFVGKVTISRLTCGECSIIYVDISALFYVLVSGSCQIWGIGRLVYGLSSLMDLLPPPPLLA